MIQQKNNQKRSRFSLLPSDEPVTMRDRYNSFFDQFLYDNDYDQASEESQGNLKKTSVCAVWPRPRFMLQINTPSASNLQQFYQSKLNIMPTVKINQTPGTLMYQKRKYHTKKEESLNKTNYTNLSAKSSSNTILSNSEESNSGIYQHNDSQFTLPQLQINNSQSSKNSSEFSSSSQNDSINSSQSQNEETYQSQEQDRDEAIIKSEQGTPLNSSLSQPQIMYQAQQLKTKKIKAKIIQHPLNVSGIQLALQQQEQLVKLNPYQKLQQIQQLQKFQSRNKTQTQKQVQNPNQNEPEINIEGIKNEIEGENTNVDETDESQTDPNKDTKKRKYKPRQSFTPEQKMLLEKFIFDHIDHPYAEHEDLVMLERQTKLSRKQIRVFMTNTRMRKFAGNKIPVLKKSGNIVMRKGVPLHGPIGRVDPKNQCLIQCFPKKIGYPMQIPMASLQTLKKNEGQNNPNNKDNENE